MTIEKGNAKDLLKSLVDTMHKQEVREDEFTVKGFMKEGQCDRASARRFLENEVKNGRLISRQAFHDKRACLAYSRPTADD